MRSLNCEETLPYFSPKDYRFAKWKKEGEIFTNFLQTALESDDFKLWHDRFNGWKFAAEKCATYLGFRTTPNGLKLNEANFCKHRLCPICARRRSEIWNAKIAEVFNRLSEEQTKEVEENLIFLTLTIKNIPLSELPQKRRFLSDSFNRLIKNTLREKNLLRGYLRGFELTKGKRYQLECNPHFHILLYVDPKYWDNRIEKMSWVKAWAAAARLDYMPSIWINKVDGVRGAAFEVCKYELKPQNYTTDWRWTSNLAIYNYRAKRISTGGWFKENFRFLEREPEDLIHEIDRDYEPGGKAAKMYYFSWNPMYKHHVVIREEAYYG